MLVPVSMNIKPSSRILSVLGDIEFEPWQCVAELVDNSFDDFLEIERSGLHWPDGFKASVALPDRASAEATLVVQDSGRGMSIETLNSAVRAGWSSNDRFSKLGLFGMGFNIATARLGRVARVFTTRSQDEEWLGVEIDLDRIGDDFEVPILRRPKALGEHGTLVEITRLEPSRAAWLAKNAAKIRATLGDVYSYLLSQRPFNLYVDGVKVIGRQACVWAETRSVTYGSGSTAEQIPALIKIDEQMPEAEACLTCGRWQQPGLGVCSDCGSTALEARSRRIHGWLGIQRYLHKTEFGIDFLRNGRKILRQDKRLFTWVDQNDPLAAPEVEYPVELGQGGRIVGEIHLDHIPVNYQKNAFEWSDRQWIAAVHYLRGRGPLLPKRAREAGYPPNDSLLGRLHKGYRRTDPGYRSLIPGNGLGPIHTDTLEWRDKFHKAVSEYQADSKWWDAVVYHEIKAATGAAPTGVRDDVLSELGLANPIGGPEPSSAIVTSDLANSAVVASDNKARETDRQRADRLRTVGVQMPSLSKDFGLADLGAGLEVSTVAVREPITDSNNNPTPVWLWRESGKKYLAVIDTTHSVFQKYPVDPAVLLSVEIANHLRIRADSQLPLPYLVAVLLDQRLPDLRIDQGSLAAEARDLLGSIRRRMAGAISSNPDRAWQHLSVEERATTETNLLVEDASESLQEVQKSGDFLLYVPATFLPRLAEEWPEAFLDAKVFKGTFTGVSTTAGKHISVGRIVSYLYDAAVIAEAKVNSPTALSRCALSLQLLRTELSSAEEP
jgi:hypothetical protein